MAYTAQQVQEMQEELDSLMVRRPELRRLSDRKMNKLVARLTDAFAAGHRGDALIAALSR